MNLFPIPSLEALVQLVVFLSVLVGLLHLFKWMGGTADD